MAKFRPFKFAVSVLRGIVEIGREIHTAREDDVITLEEARAIGYASVDEALMVMVDAGVQFGEEPEEPADEPDRPARILARAIEIRPSILARLQRGKPAPTPES